MRRTASAPGDGLSPAAKATIACAPKVTNFGLAKKIEEEQGMTATGQILGTPAYMPPEQASGSMSDVTETADVYSLGAILYCLAACLVVLMSAGFGGPLLAFKQREIAGKEVQLRKGADDARQEATDERDEARRQRAIAEQQGAIAERERQLAQRRLAEGQLSLGKAALQNNNPAEALNWYLHTYLNSPPGDATRVGARNIIGSYLDELPRTLVQPATVHRLAVSPDGKTLWVAYLASQSQLWDLSSGKPVGKPLSHHGDVVSGDFSPDGKTLLTSDWRGATAWNAATGEPRFGQLDHANREDTMRPPAFSPDGRTIATRDTLESIRLWDAKTGAPRCESLPHGAGVWRIVFSQDSKLVAVRSGDDVRIWEAETGEPQGEPLRGISDFTFHPDSQILAICDKDGKLSLRNVRNAVLAADLPHDEPMTNVQFDAAGRHLFASYQSYGAAASKTAVVWRNALGDDRSKLVIPQVPRLTSGALSPDGELVTLTDRWRLRVVRTSNGDAIWERSVPSAAPFEDIGSFGAVEFSPDGKSVLARNGGGIQVFSVGRGWLLAEERNLRCFAFMPDGQHVVCGSEFGWARIRAVRAVDSRHVATLVHPVDKRDITHTSFTSSGRMVVTAGRDKIVQFWDAETWKPTGAPLVHDLPIVGLAISPDDKTFVLLAQLPKPDTAKLFDPTPTQLEFWDLATRTRIGEPIPFPQGVYRADFDVTGKTLYVAGSLYDAVTRKLRPVQPAADGEFLAVANLLRSIGGRPPRLWDDQRGSPTRVRRPADDFLHPLVTTGGRLIAQNKLREIRLWDAESGEALGPVFQIDGLPLFRSADGRYVVAGAHAAVQIWDTYTGKRCGEPLADSHAQMQASFDPTGSMLATYEGFYTRLWDCATGQMLGPPLQNNSTGEYDLDFSPDGRWLLSTDGRVQVFKVPQSAVDDPERLQLLVEVRTGLRVDENGTLQKLRHEEWLDRKRRLDQLGDSNSNP